MVHHGNRYTKAYNIVVALLISEIGGALSTSPESDRSPVFALSLTTSVLMTTTE